MARVSIFYDKDVKEQFFMVRGDERYARSTKTVISLGERLESVTGFCQEIIVNVLRDRGTGNITIYDNDNVIDVITDWNSESGERTIQLTGLNYNIDHNIMAKYMGNGNCSPSNSNILNFNVIDSKRPESTLSFDNTVQYNPNAEITKTITLSNEVMALYNDGMDIEIYYDDVLLEDMPITTDEGVATFTLPTGSNGLHTLKAVFDGSENLLPSSTTQTVSVGFKIEAVSYPTLQIAGNTYDFKAKVTNFFGIPVTGVSVKLWGYPSEVIVAAGNTDSQGVATINTIVVDDDNVAFTVAVGGVTYYTPDTFFVDYYAPSTMTVASSPRLYKGNEGFIQYTIDRALANVPILVNQDFDDPETIYTNSQGVATKQLMGTGEGKQTWQGRLGNIYKETMIDDFASYWQGTTKINWNFDIDAPIIDFNNYHQISPTQLGNYYFTIYNQNKDKDYIFKMYDVISQASNGTLRDVYFVKGNGEKIVISSPNYATLTVRRDAGVVTVYKDNTLVGTATGQDNYPIKLMVLQKTNFSRMELIEKSTYEVL